MLNIKTKIILFLLLIYQSPVFSKSDIYKDFDSKNLSNYFSGIVAFENKNNSKALDYFNSSKILINRHDPYLEKLVMTLVLENKVSNAINIIKTNKGKNNSNFFEAYILLTLDSIKKNDLNRASRYLIEASKFTKKNKFNYVILKTLQQYIFVFKDKKLLKDKETFGNFSIINETFQRCYLDDENTSAFFSKLINSDQADYSRYIYFYITFLIQNNQIEEARKITSDIDYISATLLLSQGKSWVDKNELKKFNEIFSCKNYNDVTGEFLFLISNLYSSQDEFEKSNFYLSLSIYLNPKFVFNSSLVSENLYLNKNYTKAKEILRNFKKDQDFYYWYRIKKEAQIISKTKSQDDGLNYITSKFSEIKNPNYKFIFDVANFHKNSRKYAGAIKYYSMIIDNLNEDSDLKSDLLYRRGGSYERLKDFDNADKDLLNSLKIKPNDAYVLNYLAYSWLERGYKIEAAMQMLEKAYASQSNDPYIIDSIGWAYYLIDDFIRAEKFIKRAVELMPYDPIVSDHYGDILWKLDRKIQARYFWSLVLEMENVEEELIEKINNKLIVGIEKS